MSKYIGNIFANLHFSTQNLDAAILDKTTELIYCYRSGVESVTLVTDNKETLRALVGTLPTEIYDTNRYAVDLSTIGTEKVRIYLNSQDDNEHIIGYYFDSNNSVLQKKHYKKSNDADAMIDRYDGNGASLSTNEAELSASKSDWGGNSALANNIERVAGENNINLLYAKRQNKDQSYIKVAAHAQYQF